MRNNQATKDDVKREIHQRKLDGCCICKEMDTCCLEFHHRDASTKLFGINTGMKQYGRAKVRAEMAKCVVLCSNCHKKVWAGHLSIPADVEQRA